MSENKRQKPSILIRLVGDGVRPKVVPVHAVASLLKACQKIALGAEVQPTEDRKQPTNRLSLVSVKSGSAVYGCYTEDARKAYQRIKLANEIAKDPDWKPSNHRVSKALTDRQFAEYIYAPLSELSKVAHSTNTRIEFYLASRQRALFTCEADTFHNYNLRMASTGPTTVYAKIVRVGGVMDRKCMVRPFDQQKLVYCRVASEETAKQLGKHLYSDAILTGLATKMNFSGELRGMVIEAMKPFKRLTAGELIEEMREVGGMAFDNVDMEELERELYG